jgi:hypothetical protein
MTNIPQSVTDILGENPQSLPTTRLARIWFDLGEGPESAADWIVGEIESRGIDLNDALAALDS